MGDEGFRPPPEHAEKPDHWLERDGEEPSLWTWAPTIGWAMLVKHQSQSPSKMARDGYRYLGPAEWRDEAAQAAVDAMMSSRHVEDLAALEDAAVRIASLESQLTAAAALQTGGDAGEYWAETWHKCNLESEAAVCRSRELEAQNARLLNENAMLRAHPPLSRIPNGGLYQWDADVGQWKPTGAVRVTPNETVRIDLLAALPDEPRAIDAPDDPVHRAVRDTIDHLAKGLVTPPARKALRDSLDKADAPPVGRAKADQGLGRAVTRVAGVVAPEFGGGGGF